MAPDQQSGDGLAMRKLRARQTGPRNDHTAGKRSASHPCRWRDSCPGHRAWDPPSRCYGATDLMSTRGAGLLASTSAYNLRLTIQELDSGTMEGSSVVTAAQPPGIHTRFPILPRLGNHGHSSCLMTPTYGVAFQITVLDMVFSAFEVKSWGEGWGGFFTGMRGVNARPTISGPPVAATVPKRPRQVGPNRPTRVTDVRNSTRSRHPSARIATARSLM